MAAIERSIEEMIEEAEDTEETVPTSQAPIHHPTSLEKKPKKPRSQKQIESLAKARQARADKIAKTKVQAPSNDEGNNVAAPRLPQKKREKKQRKIVIENEDGTSSEEEIIVIKNKSKKKKRKQPRVVYQQESSSSEEEAEEYYPKTSYASYRFL